MSFFEEIFGEPFWVKRDREVRAEKRKAGVNWPELIKRKYSKVLYDGKLYSVTVEEIEIQKVAK